MKNCPLADSFPRSVDVTSFGSGWRTDVVNQCLESVRIQVQQVIAVQNARCPTTLRFRWLRSRFAVAVTVEFRRGRCLRECLIYSSLSIIVQTPSSLLHSLSTKPASCLAFFYLSAASAGTDAPVCVSLEKGVVY